MLDAEQWNRQWLGRDQDGGVVDCVMGVAGLYGTAPTCYLSLAARLPGFVRADLDRELYEKRSLVRMRALRGSGFMMPIQLADMLASSEDRKGWYGQYVDKIIDVEGREELSREVLDVLSGRVMTTRQIRQELGLEGPRAEALKYLMSMLGGQRQIANATVTGGWRSNQFSYALWEEWFPDAPPRDLDPVQARIDVARWYLSGHGPATVDDFKWWSGFKKTNARIALENCGAVEVETEIGLMYDLPDREAPPAPSGLRLLPVWDTAIVTQASRRRMVAERFHRYVYDRDGNATSTIAREGEVVGVWDRQGDDESFTVKAAPLEDFGEDEWDEIEGEAAVLATALGSDQLDVVRIERPVDLHEAKRNRFLSPLSGP